MNDKPWIVPPPALPINGNDAIVGTDARVSDFWQFAMSDLRMNNTRGYFAEFLVARALGLNNVTRVEWDAYDLLLGDVRIEVKSSAYLQAWEQRQLSRISFSGLRGTRYHPRYGYDPSGKGLNAHVYVFCVQTATSHRELDPLDVGQWAFYVVKRSALEKVAGASIGLDSVMRLAMNDTNWNDLRVSVLDAAVGEEINDSIWWE